MLQAKFAARKIKPNAVQKPVEQSNQEHTTLQKTELSKAKSRARYNKIACTLRNIKFKETLLKRITDCKCATESEFKGAIDSVLELTTTLKPLLKYILSLFDLLKDVPVA